MPRQKRPNRRRTDIYIDMDDPAWCEVVTEAELRGVTVQQHLYDLIRARWLARQGQARMADLFWLPGESPPTPAPPTEPPPVPDAPAPDHRPAEAMKDAWLGMLNTQDEAE
jgi:hypothetical protein